MRHIRPGNLGQSVHETIQVLAQQTNKLLSKPSPIAVLNVLSSLIHALPGRAMACSFHWRSSLPSSASSPSPSLVLEPSSSTSIALATSAPSTTLGTPTGGPELGQRTHPVGLLFLQTGFNINSKYMSMKIICELLITDGTRCSDRRESLALRPVPPLSPRTPLRWGEKTTTDKNLFYVKGNRSESWSQQMTWNYFQRRGWGSCPTNSPCCTTVI